MSQKTEDSRIRSLVKYHYIRNRHLSTTHDDDDLFQDTWIQLNDAAPHGAEDEGMSQDQLLRRAVRRATDRAFGKLRKRCFRGTATETLLEFDPADCYPDHDLVMDLRSLIESLPIQERLVIELLRRGYDGTEIAELLELSPQAVTRRKQKAIEKLRHGLSARL